ncbi:MAG: ABC transporter permease [Oscillospiraceae bacterium]|nr:ABC transporter permease [Oscillospiraceae bacterium]
MKKYLTIFRIRFIHGVQYRIVVFSLIFTGFLWGLMLVLAYSAFYRNDPAAFPMTLSETISYMWLQQAFLILFSVVFADVEIETSIESGAIAYELVRPADLYGRWFSRACAGRAAFTVFRLPLLIIVFFLPAPYNLSIPPDIFQAIMFLPSTALALGVTTAFAMLMYVSMFYTTSYRGVRVLLIAATAFFTGAVIPFPFFPATVRTVLETLPFAAMQNMPLRIYSGNIAGMDALNGILFQIIWLVLLVAAGKLLMRRALRKVTVQGG